MSHRREPKLTLNKVNFSDIANSMRWPYREDRRRRQNSIAGDGLSGPEVVPHRPFEPSISGGLTGDLGVPGYEPDGISWLPHPATSAHRATARRRSSVPIGAGRINLSPAPPQKNLRNRARSSRDPFNLILPVAYAL